MKIATAEQMRAIDRRAMEEYGIPGIVLMESAGAAFARACQEELGGNAAGKRVLMLCGKGNNGGDGFVAARYLANAGAEVTVFLAGKASDLKGDAAAHFAPLRRMPVRIAEADDNPSALPNERPDLIGDALLGTGAHGPIAPDSEVGKALTRLRALIGSGAAAIPVVAADLPTGLDAETGTVDPLAVRATRTVTFALPKPGLLQYPGLENVGRLTVADIGIPRALLTDAALGMEMTTADEMRRLLPPRSESRDANKGTFGTLLVIAGSAGMAGAAALSAMSALRAGAGLVQLAVPVSLLDTAAALAPEVILKGLPETAARTHGGPGALEAALSLAEKADAVAFGPGLGGTEEAVRFVQELCRHLLSPERAKPLVVDADGLNALAKGGPEILAGHDARIPFVLTPHPGEMGRLLGTDTRQVQADRQAAARECAERFGAVSLLKGARTLIATNDGRLAFNRKGSVALATAGSGDVLTGVIGALLSNRLNGYDAARAGAYLHALAGELCALEIGRAGTIAADVRDRLPAARAKLYRNEPLDEL